MAVRAQRSEPWREALRICVPCGSPALVSRAPTNLEGSGVEGRTGRDRLVNLNLLAQILKAGRYGHQMHDGGLVKQQQKRQQQEEQ